MTVGELKRLIAGIPDETVIQIMERWPCNPVITVSEPEDFDSSQLTWKPTEKLLILGSQP